MLSRLMQRSALKQSLSLSVLSVRALVGSAIPGGNLFSLTADGPVKHSTTEYFANKKVVVFAIPGAFTPTCQSVHVPSYESKAAEFKALGIEVVCLATNDVFVLKSFQETTAAASVQFMSDPDVSFCTALGKTFDGSAKSLGSRPLRFSMYVENGKIEQYFEEKSPGEMVVTDAETLLNAIKNKSLK